MEPLPQAIASSTLFQGLDASEAETVLACLGARTAFFAKGSRILSVGDAHILMGMVVEGEVRVEREDYWGNRTIISLLKPGQLFGEVYACKPDLPLDVNAVAASDATVLLIDAQRIMAPCSSACDFHSRLSLNLLSAIAGRAYVLTRKIDHLSRRSTREKLLAFLSDQAKAANSNAFSIPYNRQELADYLSVDRSAMTTELTRMHAEGLVNFEKNRFYLPRSSSL